MRSPRPALRRWLRRTCLLVAVVVVAANALAYLHARALTHFTGPGPRTRKPEALTLREKVRTLMLGARVPRPMNTRCPSDVGMEFETRTIPSSNGVVLEAWLVRHPSPVGWVLLFHGYSESKQQLLPALGRFHDLGYSTVSVDFRASGGSTGGNTTTIGYFEAEDVATTVHWARSVLRAREPILYGFSMGSSAVLRAVGRLRVEAKALVIEAPFDRMLGTIENRFRIMGVPAFPMARLLVFWGGLQNGFPGLAHNPVDYAAAVTCPTLLIHGEQDQRVTVAQARSIYDHLAGPKQLRVVPGVGHEATEGMSPDLWQEIVGGFLRGIGTGPNNAASAR